MSTRMSRRQLLRALAGAAARLGLGALSGCGPSPSRAEDGITSRAYLPLITHSPPLATEPSPTEPPPTEPSPTEPPPTQPPPPTSSRVVHVHSADATFWDFGDDYYGDYVDQNVVNDMVDYGVMTLTGAGSVAQAWQVLMPDYAAGKGIAIKVNFNNCRWCDKCRSDCGELGHTIDALIHPINGLAHSLLQAFPGFAPSDLWVYDATTAGEPRHIPALFKDGCLYHGVRFFDQGCSEVAGYSSNDPSSMVEWHNPADVPTPPSTKVTDVLVNATYLINMPIMKKHVRGVTLAFKNHFGSIDDCAPLHDWFIPDRPHYRGVDYSPLVDIYRNHHIASKTVLTIGDGLYGNWEDNISKPQPWMTFEGLAPNSLMFGLDPVAMDCVMCDLLASETWMPANHDDYLVFADACGLGVYERCIPCQSDSYSLIDYVRVEMSR